MIRFFSSLFLFLLCSLPLIGQQSIVEFEIDLLKNSKIVFADTLLENRTKAHQIIKSSLAEALADSTSFHHPFDSIKHLSIQYPQDSSFRIFSWQLYEDLNHYRYGGIIQEVANNRITVLEDQAVEIMDPEFDIVNSDEWFGCVYYNIKDFESEKGKAYLVFGINSYKMLENQKLVDVITFGEEGPKFGAPVFFQPNGLKAEKRRLLYTYSAESSFNLNWDDGLELIIFDNLAPGRSIRGTSVWMPDGTYMGYKLNGNKWVFEEKLFHEVLDKAPVEVPVLNSRKDKDIFGKPQRVRDKLSKASPSGNKPVKKEKPKTQN